MHDVTKLRIWDKALELAEKIYSLTAGFPREESYGLSSQMKRAVVSIGSNIAEGAGRNSNREFYQFIGISCGSASELRFQIELSYRCSFINTDQRDELISDIDYIMRMNFRLQSRIRSEENDRNKRNSPRQGS